MHRPRQLYKGLCTPHLRQHPLSPPGVFNPSPADVASFPFNESSPVEFLHDSFDVSIDDLL